MSTRLPVIATIVIVMSALLGANCQAQDDPGYVVLRRPGGNSWAVPPWHFTQAPSGILSGTMELGSQLPAMDSMVNESLVAPAFVPCFNCGAKPNRSSFAGQSNPTVTEVYQKPYAYGWFGVAPGQAGTRSVSGGYHGQSTTWRFE